MNAPLALLASRSGPDFLAHAATLRSMAATASTPEVREALLRLADRYAALAAERS